MPNTIKYISQDKSMNCWLACIIMLLLYRKSDTKKIIGNRTIITDSSNIGVFDKTGANRLKEMFQDKKYINEIGEIMVNSSISPYSIGDILDECRLKYNNFFRPNKKDESDYKYLLQLYGPIAACITKPRIGRHVVIIKKIKKNSIIINDPDPSFGENYEYRLRDFNNMIAWGAPIPFFWG